MAREKTQFGPALEDGSYGDSTDRIKGDRGQIVARAVGADEGMDDKREDTNEWGFDALGVARDAYSDGKDFMDSSLRTRWEAAERQFANRHPSGSKYFQDAYKGKSSLFRPKTRAAIRQSEAQAAASFFANDDVAKVAPVDPDNPMQTAAASILHEVLKVRLTAPNARLAIPWFLTLVGAYQDAEKNGVCITKQWWEYRTLDEIHHEPVTDEETGEPMEEDGAPVMRSKRVPRVVVDRPRCDILAPENVIIDRGASWIDPIGTSPYVIVMHPMYIDEVEARMYNQDPKTGQPAWKPLDRSILKQALHSNQSDPTRQEREGKREDSKDSRNAVDEFQIIWIHENFVRWDDIDYVYYTVADRHLLTDPVPVQEVYPHCEIGERPIVMGQAIIETNKLYPAGKPELVAGLQMEANEIVNQRLDNVKLALNKRYLVRRGSQTDLRSLVRNFAGSVTLTNNPQEDIETLETRDVTASSYQEQDRINADFDEIAGSFSVGSVATNRRLGETVGGMSLISGSANSLGELDLRVFTETWVQPVLSQIVRMLQYFETDENVLEIAGRRAQIWQRFQMMVINDQLLMQDVMVKVDVGIGATDPMQRLQKFEMGAKIIGEIFGPSLAPNLKANEVVKEIMSLLGYRDGARFYDFDKPSPIVNQLQQQLQELTKKLETKEADRLSRAEVAQINAMAKIITQSIDSQQRAEQHAQDGVGDLEAEMARVNIDAQAKERELAMKEREHAMDLQFKAEDHAMDRQIRQEEAALNRQERQEDHEMDRQSRMLDIFHQHVTGQEKIGSMRQMSEIKASQAAQGRPGKEGAPGTKPVKIPERETLSPPNMQGMAPDMSDEIAKVLSQQTQALQQLAQMVVAAVDTLNAPKEIVRDANGRPIGVRSRRQPNG